MLTDPSGRVIHPDVSTHRPKEPLGAVERELAEWLVENATAALSTFIAEAAMKGVTAKQLRRIRRRQDWQDVVRQLEDETLGPPQPAAALPSATWYPPNPTAYRERDDDRPPRRERSKSTWDVIHEQTSESAEMPPAGGGMWMTWEEARRKGANIAGYPS